MADEYIELEHTAAEVDGAIADIASHIANSTIHVTQSEKNEWSMKASAADLAAEVAAREAADTALQTAVSAEKTAR